MTEDRRQRTRLRSSSYAAARRRQRHKNLEIGPAVLPVWRNFGAAGVRTSEVKIESVLQKTKRTTDINGHTPILN